MLRKLIALLLAVVLLVPMIALAASPSNATRSNTRHSTRSSTGYDDDDDYSYANPNDGPVTVTTVGCTVAKAGANGKAVGGASYFVEFEEGIGNVYIAAEIPSGKKIAYWVINGVRYDFKPIPTKYPVMNVNEDLTIECVLRGATPKTLLTAEDIEEARVEGEPLVVRLNKAQMCHLLNDTKGGGGWITEFDFTYDYKNRATGATVRGGTYTFKMKPTNAGRRTVRAWKFNDMEFRFAGNTVDVIVRGLNTSMTYEPLFK